MSLAVIHDLTNLRVDLSRDGGNLLTDEGLDAAVIISVFTDRYVEPDDELPPDTTDHKGWWGDAYAKASGDHIGSRLWTHARSLLTAGRLVEVREFILEALNWMTVEGVVDEVLVDVWREGDRRYFRVTLARPTDLTSRWSKIWELKFDGV